ncbi:rod shape-determining protein MreD [Frigidibacter sp. MR17.14]|uniref:rod shape-determining protein MreD n=1 Tax=Frigidibacter sp. MR17.14 TaxID=3126509 RepID=UPI003012BD67
MIDPATSRRWSLRLLFVGLAIFLMFLRILPLSTLPPRIPGPDLLLCLALAWVLRRPDVVSAPLLVAVFLLEDMLTMRPPGLWTLMVLFGSEFLRDRASAVRRLPFAVDWAMAAAVIFFITIGYRAVLALAMIPRPALWMTAMQTVATMLAYPAVVGATHLVARALPGPPERDGTPRGLGRRLGRRA